MNTTPHFSASADKNKQVIYEQLQMLLPEHASVLEIASGTVQHANYFTEQSKGWIWQPSDRDLNEYGLVNNAQSHHQKNLLEPIELDLSNWPTLDRKYDAVYSANCIHIIPEILVEPYVVGAAGALDKGGRLCVYGPYKYQDEFTTPSNAQFNDWLKTQYPGSGIKDFEMLDALANTNGLTLEKDVAMPANNQFISWIKA